MAELIPSHVQKVFARVYHESRTLSPTQLVVAVESHAGRGEGAEVVLSAASAAVAKAVAMHTRGKTLLERVEPILFGVMRACFAFMRVVDMSCGFRILTSSRKCA